MLSALEIRRKIFHIMGGLIYVVLIYFDILDVVISGILLIIFIILSGLLKKYKIPILHSTLSYFERPENMEGVPGRGNLWYMASIFFCLLLFEKNIALASLTILAIGDAIAPLVGQYGKMLNPFNNKKFIEGGIAGALAAALGAWFFVVWWEALLAASAAMIAEGIGLKIGRRPVDDNIIIPFIAGVIIMILRNLI